MNKGVQQKQRVLVVFGIKLSSEYEVSCKTAENVINALKNAGFEVCSVDGLDCEKLIQMIENWKPDYVFNTTHGFYGEDGQLRSFLSKWGVKVTHSGRLTSKICMDKDMTKEIAVGINIPVAPSQKMIFKDFIQYGTNVAMPYVIKPNTGGSSVGVYIVKEKKDLNNLQFNDDVEILIEKYVYGREFTVGILNGVVLEVTEICPKTGFYDYQNKYQFGKTDHILPAQIPVSLRQDMMAYTKKLYDALGCKGPARVDFRYNSNDGIVMLEINTQPGMTETSLLPEQAEYLGYSFQELCVEILKSAYSECNE